MYEAIEHMVLARCIESQQGLTQQHHPFILGTFDAFYQSFKDDPEKIAHLETLSTAIAELIEKEIPICTWQERYVEYAQIQLQEQNLSVA